ncbi:MAG: hypothetical protein IPL65_03595 [Lewinellaceae bacterium]|nr:hypothetical protein [Lewinellaceae bacterium]
MAKKKLKIGLTMAGAVSAGAYTAGVMDYLFETLDKWEKAKAFNRAHPDKADPSVPMHDVEICVMGGASAGGMTTAITMAALRDGLRPIPYEEYKQRANDPEAKKDFAKNRFFDSWVNLIADDMMPELLGTQDIQELKEKNVASLLNSNFVAQIADRAFSDDNLEQPILPPYVNEGLELILTLTNLEGYEIQFPFRGQSGTNLTYISTTHRDFAHFKRVLISTILHRDKSRSDTTTKILFVGSVKPLWLQGPSLLG